jgi:hypothetical protein
VLVVQVVLLSSSFLCYPASGISGSSFSGNSAGVTDSCVRSGSCGLVLLRVSQSVEGASSFSYSLVCWDHF